MMMSVSIFVILLGLIMFGVPVAVAIGLSSVAAITIFDLNLPLTTVAARCFSGVDSFTLMAIPFFVFAGELMNKAGITKRVLDIADALVGSLKGGLTYVNCLAAMMMASISGSGTACAAALGVSLIPDMEKRGYSKEYAVSLTSCANVVGPIIPPSTLFILFAYYTGASVIRLFVGGILPGVCIGVGLMAVGSVICRKKGYRQEAQPFSLRKLGAALRTGWVAVLVPVFLFLSIVCGWSTATEAGAVVCAISLILGIAFRAITSWKDLMEVTKNAASSTCTIFTLLALSGIFSSVLVRAHFTDIVSEILTSISSSNIGLLIAIVVFIFVLGMFVDVTPMITMFAAPFAVCATAAGVDLTHFGVVFVLICMVGAVTPPVGGILFVTTTIGRIPMTRIVKMLLPMLAWLFALTILVIVFPPFVTFVPNLLFGAG